MNIDKLSKETIIQIVKDIIYNQNMTKFENNTNIPESVRFQIEDKDTQRYIYLSILDIFSNRFGIYIDYENIPNDEVLFNLCNLLYKLIISNTYKDILEFIITYIKNNTNSIYKTLEFDKLKRSKDIDTIYNIGETNDTVIGTILSKLISVIDYIILSIDFSNVDILKFAKYSKEDIELLIKYTNNIPFIITKYQEFISLDNVKSNINNDIRLYFYNENSLRLI